MRKLSKILAIVLAMVMVLCPVLTAAAETEAIVYDDIALTVGEIADDGSANATVYVATNEVVFNAVDFKLQLGDGVDFAADVTVDDDVWNVSYNYDADSKVLTVLAIDNSAAFEGTQELTFTVPVTVSNAANYSLNLAKIYVIGAGAADTDEVAANFPYADNDKSGVIDVAAAKAAGFEGYFAGFVCEHTETETVVVDPTCTAAGSSTVVCLACGHSVTTEIPAIPHDFNVDGVLIAATEEAVGYGAFNVACTVCGTLNPDYYNAEGELIVTADDLAALVEDGNVYEIEKLEVVCDHAETEEVVVKDATCTEAGSKNIVCSACGEVIETVEIPAKGHTEGEAVKENIVDATATTAGSYDSVVYCSVCGVELSRETIEVPATGPAVDDTLVVAGAAVGFGIGSLQVNFRIRKTVIDVAKYSKVELVIIPQKYDTTTYNLADPVEIVPTLTAAGNFYTYAYGDIYLYELGLNIDYMLRAYDANGNVVAVSPTYTTSAASYLKTSYAASTDAKFRTLAVDTLVVGARAVEGTAANYADSDLAKATSIIEGFDISEATPSIGTYNTIDEFTSYDANFTTATSATHRVMKSVTIGKAPYIGFRIKDQKSALDLTKISFKVSYTKNEGVGVEVPYEKTFDSTNTTFAKAGQFITFSFAEIGIQDGNKDIAIEIYYDGTMVCDMTYSIETYLGANLSSSVGELAAAIIKLGASYRAYAS